MIRFVLAVTFFLMAGSIDAQDHNLLIRSDDSQPFFARLGEQTFNSSANGNLTIPGIQENTVSLVIGFPGARYPEQNFSIVMKSAEMSFLLKKADGNRWMLQSAPELKKESVNLSGARKQDAFSILMAGVVNDTAVLYNTSPQEEPSKDTVATVPRPTTTTTAPPIAVTTKTKGKQPVKKPGGKKASVATGAATVAVASAHPTQKMTDTASNANHADNSQAWIPGIFKVYEKKLGTALKLIYVDVSEQGKIDSVDMQIVYETDSPKTPGANPEKVVVKSNQEVSSNANPSTDKPVTTVEKKPAAPVILTQGADKKPDSAMVVKKEPVKKADTVLLVKTTPPQKTVVNTNCRELATEYDEDKIRVKMMNQPSDDDKVTEARKFFKQKCYSVKQLRNLSEVFPQDEGRYKFFDAAYPYVSDSENFNQLQALLIDPYYINRFKAMLKNN